MKNISKICLCITLSIGIYIGEIQAQEKDYQKFDFELNYGFAYSDSWYKKSGYKNINPNKIGTYATIALNYHLSEKASIGFSYTYQNLSKTVKNYKEDQTYFILKLEDFYLLHTYQFYDVTYKRKIGKYISAIGGLGFFIQKRNYFMGSELNQLETGPLEENRYGAPYYVWTGVKPRADDFAAIAGLSAAYPINKNISIGVTSLLKYSFGGIESLSLSPNIKINF